LDNGTGIESNKFEDEMVKIGASSKKKQRNMGYKGIGRLSGVPYCKKLIFTNIIDYANKVVQTYTIDTLKYEKIKNDETYATLSFVELMKIIGQYCDESESVNSPDLFSVIQKYDELMRINNSGFLVILNDITMVLNNTIYNDDFLQQLGWLLPVNFFDNLYKSKAGELFDEITTEDDSKIIPARYCSIYYNDHPVCLDLIKRRKC